MSIPWCPNLTPQQWAVLARLAQGERTAAIAAALGVRPQAVAGQLTHIYRQVPRDPLLTKRASAGAWYQAVGRALREQDTFRVSWREAELAQIDRTLECVDESFAMVVTFLAKRPETEALQAEAQYLASRSQALRAKCARLND